VTASGRFRDLSHEAFSVATKWGDLPKTVGGVYGIWAADRKSIYIGSTGRLAGRVLAHRPAELLGCETVVGMLLPDTTRKERCRIEDRIILALRARGVVVVNNTNMENHALYLSLGPERYREIAASGLGKQTHAQRVENGRKGAQALTREQRQAARAKLPKEAAMRGTANGVRRMTTEERQTYGRKGAEARWRKGV
jgi:hypothetical protein